MKKADKYNEITHTKCLAHSSVILFLLPFLGYYLIFSPHDDIFEFHVL